MIAMIERTRLQYLMLYISLALLFYVSYLLSLYYLKLVFGLIAFIVMPGILLTKLINNFDRSVFIFESILWGYILQYLIFAFGFTFYWIFNLQINTALLLIFGNFIVIFLLLHVGSISSFKLEYNLLMKIKENIIQNKYLWTIISLGLVLRLVFLLYNYETILPDGSLYFDYARNIVERSSYISSVLNDEVFPFATLSFGFLIPHEFVTFPIAFSMTIFNVSYVGARISVLIPGLISFVPIFKIIKRSFSDRAANIFAILFLLSPFFVYFSSILHGPEINAFLLLMTIFDLLFKKSVNSTSIMISGILLGVSQMVWFPATYAFFLILPFIFAYRIQGNIRSFLRLLIFEIISVIFIVIHNGLVKFGVFSALIFVSSAIFYGYLRFYVSKSSSILQFIELFASSIIARLGDIPAAIYQIMTFGTIKRNSLIVPIVFPTVESITKTIIISSINICIVIVILSVFYYLTSLRNRISIIFGAAYLINIVLFAVYLSPSYYLLNFSYVYDIGRYFHIASAFSIIGTSLLIYNLSKRIPKYYAGVLLAFIIIFISFNYTYAYFDRARYISDHDPVRNYGWTNVIPWIKTNVLPNETIGCVQQRELTYFSNRIAIKIYNASNLIQNLTYSRLELLLKNLKPDYLLVDVPFRNVYPNVDLYSIPLNISRSYVFTDSGIIPGNHSDVVLKLVYQEYNTEFNIYVRLFSISYPY